MKRYGQLLERMAEEMMIAKGNTESDTDYMMRILFSSLGRQAYASLWDTLEDIEHEQNPVSETHFRQRIKTLLHGFHQMYPEIQHTFYPDAEKACDTIYSLFRKFEMYHSPYRLKPAAFREAAVGNVVFLRGADPLESCAVSGIGAYRLSEESVNSCEAAAEMFQFSEKHPTAIWEYVCSHANWTAYDKTESLEYLRTVPPFTRGYWSEHPSDGMMIARTKSREPRLYYLCRSEKGELMTSQLPTWRTDEGEYRLLAAGLLMQMNCYPPIRYHLDGARVLLHIDYLLPPSEQAFLELYSWGEQAGQSSFHRICSHRIFPAIKQLLESAGNMMIEE